VKYYLSLSQAVVSLGFLDVRKGMNVIAQRRTITAEDVAGRMYYSQVKEMLCTIMYLGRRPVI